MGNSEDMTTHFQEPSVGAWNRKISRYASFAEYSEPPYEADGVSDTGVTLRAFLPFGTAQDRENLETYKGNLTVLDARVTCQVPRIENATVGSEFRFRGSLAATRNTPRLVNNIWDEGSYGGASEGKGVHPEGLRDFDCALTSEAYTPNDPADSQWGISLCQLWQGDVLNRKESFGGLYSEFQNPPLRSELGFQGSAYLLLNNSFGIFDAFGNTRSRLGLSVAVKASQERGEWLDLTYANSSDILSASICFAAFDFADIDVSVASQSNRTESRLEPVFDQDTSTYTFQELRYAMGQDGSLGMDRRGILELAKRTRLQAPDEERFEVGLPSYSTTYLRMTADLAYTRPSVSHTDPCRWQNDTCVLPEDMHILLVQDILKTNGSIAFALQTMITLLSSMAYYDQMGRFDKWTQAEARLKADGKGSSKVCLEEVDGQVSVSIIGNDEEK
ncbi:hypothetical protein SLS64_010968 [Diaporthe eres]